MKRFPIVVLGISLLLLGFSAVISCTTVTPAQQQALTTQLAAANDQANALLTQIDQAIAVEVASTQTTPPPTTAAIAVEASAVNTLQASKVAIQKAQAVATQAGPAIISIASGGDPGAAITAASGLAGPYAGYVGLAGTIISLLWGVSQNVKKSQAVAAGQTAVDAVQGALANGQLAVTSASAASAVDAALTVNHPISNALVDVIAAAPVQAIVPTPVTVAAK